MASIDFLSQAIPEITHISLKTTSIFFNLKTGKFQAYILSLKMGILKT